MRLVSSPSFPNPAAGWLSPVQQNQGGGLSSIPHSESDHNSEVKKEQRASHMRPNPQPSLGPVQTHAQAPKRLPPRVCILTPRSCQPRAQQPIMLSALVSSLPSIRVRHVKSSMTLKGFFSPLCFYLIRKDRLTAAPDNLLSTWEPYRSTSKCTWA